MAGPSQPFNLDFSLNEEDPGFVHLDQSKGIEVDSHNPQEPEPTGGKEPACSVSTTKKKRKNKIDFSCLVLFC